MKVFRVQHKVTKLGPYFNVYKKRSEHVGLTKGEKLLLSHASDNKHPIPEVFIAFNHHLNPRFGFKSLELLFSWFEESMDFLDKEGYEIVELEVEKYLYDDDLQVAFQIAGTAK